MMKHFFMISGVALLAFSTAHCGVDHQVSTLDSAKPQTVVIGQDYRFINVDIHSTVDENDAACKSQVGAEFNYQRGSEVVMTQGGTGEITPINVGDKVVIIKDPARVVLKQIKCVKS